MVWTQNEPYEYIRAYCLDAPQQLPFYFLPLLPSPLTAIVNEMTVTETETAGMLQLQPIQPWLPH